MSVNPYKMSRIALERAGTSRLKANVRVLFNTPGLDEVAVLRPEVFESAVISAIKESPTFSDADKTALVTLIEGIIANG